MVVLSRLQFINKRRSHLRKVWRSWTSSCSMSLANRSSRSEGDWWLIGVQLAVRAPLTFPRLCGESVSVASFYIHGPSHPHLPVSRRVVSSEPPLIQTVPLKSLNPGSQEAALQGPAGSLVRLPPSVGVVFSSVTTPQPSAPPLPAGPSTHRPSRLVLC